MPKSKYNPLVSIIIPVYNGENYVEKAIESALNQTYKNIEVVVVNDGSTDDTEKIVKKYGEKVRYFSKENGGVASALNYGINVAKGSYVSWLSHDDMYDARKIEEEVNYIHEDNEIIICNVTLIDKDDKVIEECIIPDMFEKSVKTFLAANPYVALNGCAMLIPKSLFEKYGYFDELLKYTQDYDLWFRFFAKGFTGDNIQEPLYLVREDLNAIKRRSLKGRMLAFQTTIIGYKMLGYPKVWLIKEFFISLFKGITPHKVQYMYRKLQQRRSK